MPLREKVRSKSAPMRTREKYSQVVETMGNENIKSPKDKKMMSPRGRKNDESNKQAKGKLGFNKESRKEMKHFTNTPSKVSFLKSRKEKNHFTTTSLNVRSLKPRNEKKYNTKTPSNDPYLNSRKEMKYISTTPSNDPSSKFRKGMKYIATTPPKDSSFKSRKETKYITRTPSRDPSSESRKEMKYNTTTPLKVSSLKSAKKNIWDKKKRFGDDSAGAMKVKPKKKKRVIRIDPYDISNKRLDDGVVFTEITNQKKDEDKEEETEKVELSMNAQFRAIKPSPSILSYVEDNFLGRRRDIELRRAGYNTEFSAPLDNVPFSTSSVRERVEESLFRNKMEFFAAAKVSSSFPPFELPEIAFAGRSNVGKSSLLNALTRQWGVVRTSDKPGHTQSINFFKLGTKLCLVDLPGYGFAYAKEDVKEAWEDLVKEYVSTRDGLKKVCLLIDTKWGMKPRDYELISLMERSQTKYQIMLTKTDTVFPIDVARRAMQIEETLKANRSVVQPVMMVSSKSGAGIRSLRTVLSKVARFVKP